MPQISASVDAKTVVAINKLASKNKRSFSEMVKILLQDGVENEKFFSAAIPKDYQKSINSVLYPKTSKKPKP